MQLPFLPLTTTHFSLFLLSFVVGVLGINHDCTSSAGIWTPSTVISNGDTAEGCQLGETFWTDYMDVVSPGFVFYVKSSNFVDPGDANFSAITHGKFEFLDVLGVPSVDISGNGVFWGYRGRIRGNLATVSGDDVFRASVFEADTSFGTIGVTTITGERFCFGAMIENTISIGTIAPTGEEAFANATLFACSLQFVTTNAPYVLAHARMRQGHVSVTSGIAPYFGAYFDGGPTTTVNLVTCAPATPSGTILYGAQVTVLLTHSPCDFAAEAPPRTVWFSAKIDSDPYNSTAIVETEYMVLNLTGGYWCHHNINPELPRFSFKIMDESVRFCPDLLWHLNEPLKELSVLFKSGESVALPRSQTPNGLFAVGKAVDINTVINLKGLIATPDTRLFVDDDTFIQSESIGLFSLTTGDPGGFPCESGRSVGIDAGSGSSLCRPSPRGTYSSSGIAIYCPAGSFSDEMGATSVSSCEACPLGSYNPLPGSTSSGCRLCPPGRFSGIPGATSFDACQECPNGAVALLAGSSQCTRCPLGSVSSGKGGTACTPCPAGTTTLSIGSEECTDCPQGRFASATGSVSCAACPAGTVAGFGATSCRGCGAGSAVTNSTRATCTLCPPGRYSQASANEECLDCPPGSAVNKTGASSCDACVAGRYAPTFGGKVCEKCIVGTYSNADGARSCAPCAAGSVQPLQGAFSCNLCNPGRFAPIEGGHECMQCDAGQFSNSRGSVACTPCLEGTYAPSTESIRCISASPGHYVPSEEAVEELECKAGSIAAVSGLAICEGCKPGTFAGSDASSTCTQCPAGRFSNITAATKCNKCPVGHVSLAGSSVCSPCRPGTVSLGGEDSCASCSRGYFQSKEGEGTCDQCPPGRFASASGASTCDPCDEGSYASGYHSTGCSLCPPGRYGGERALDICTPCPAGTTTTSPGATSRALCVEGQVTCPAGQAAHPITGNCVPVICDGGLVVGDGGACRGCPSGTRGRPVANVSIDCVDCIKGEERCPGGTMIALQAKQSPASSVFVITKRSNDQAAQDREYSSTTTLMVTIGVAVFVVLVSMGLSIVSSGTRSIVARMDSFSMQHDPPLDRPLLRRRTTVGGIISLAMGTFVIGMVVDSMLVFFERNLLETTSLVNVERASIDDPQGPADEEFSIIAQSGVDGVTCPPADSVMDAPSTWEVERVEVSGENTCGYLARCEGCEVESTIDLKASLPWHFQSGTWAVGSTAAKLPNEPNVAPSVVSGTWGSGEEGVEGISAGVDIDCSATAEVRVDATTTPRRIGYGYVMTIETANELSSSAAAEEGFLPPTIPVSITLSVKPATNALITEISERLSAVQAASLLVGAIGGITGFFALILKCCEGSSRAIISTTKNPSFNFAEVDLEPLDLLGVGNSKYKGHALDFASDNPLRSHQEAISPTKPRKWSATHAFAPTSAPLPTEEA